MWTFWWTKNICLFKAVETIVSIKTKHKKKPEIIKKQSKVFNFARLNESQRNPLSWMLVLMDIAWCYLENRQERDTIKETHLVLTYLETCLPSVRHKTRRSQHNSLLFLILNKSKKIIESNNVWNEINEPILI